VDLPVSARGHVEGRRASTPDAKILDTELAAEERQDGKSLVISTLPISSDSTALEERVPPEDRARRWHQVQGLAGAPQQTGKLSEKTCNAASNPGDSSKRRDQSATG
jgi:hypothetical protein